MPEPGQTPQPAFERGDELAYGEATEANALSDALDEQLAEEFADDDEEDAPAGMEEEFLYGPSDRPGEPISAGASFGPGPDASRFGYESDQALLERVAAQMPPALAKRILAGE